MGYWEFNKENGLKGVEPTLEELPDGRIVAHPDLNNPAVLSNDNIADSLRTSRLAREQFDRDFDSLDLESQARLRELIAENPRRTSLERDPQDFSDDVQSKGVRSIPVRTTGPHGGRWNGGRG